MFNPDQIYQRSHSGRAEIRDKKRGLTQSERLVLIMVDGVSTYKTIRAKLPVLREERFARAMRTLLNKELVLEVFLPVHGQVAEEVERSVIDRFLQQDPLDPVTIIMYDDDERLDDTSSGSVAAGFSDSTTVGTINLEANGAPVIDSKERGAALSAAFVAPANMTSPPVLREEELKEVEELSEQARSRRLKWSPHTQPVLHMPAPSLQTESKARWKDGLLLYWILALLGAFILGYAAGRMSALKEFI